MKSVDFLVEFPVDFVPEFHSHHLLHERDWLLVVFVHHDFLPEFRYRSKNRRPAHHHPLHRQRLKKVLVHAANPSPSSFRAGGRPTRITTTAPTTVPPHSGQPLALTFF